MKPIRSPRLCVEQLEARDCPSFSISLNSSNLFIRGLPAPTGPGVQIKQTAANTFNVKDNGSNLGTYVASNVNLSVINHKVAINYDLNGNTQSGNLTVDLGTGEPTGTRSKGFAISSQAGAGTISGNVMVRGGNGTENILLGENTASTKGGTLTIAGNLTVLAKANPGSVGDLLDEGTNSGTVPVVNIRGNVFTSAVNGIGFNAGSSVGGNVFLSGGGDRFQNSLGTFGAFVGGKVGGNVVVSGSQGSAGDVVGFLDPSSGVQGTIGGSVVVSLGNGTNSVFLPGTVGGSTTITALNGNNSITSGILGQTNQLNGSLNINLGNGNNSLVDFTTGGNGISSVTFTNGDTNITVGNGTNNLGTLANTTFGNLNVRLGNGTNPETKLTGTVGGTFNYTAGNGGDILTIPGGPAATTTNYVVNILFGNGDDTLNLGGGGGTLTLAGRADGGGRIVANIFNPALGFVFTQNFILSNFP